jgi:hypothetical protein
MPAKPKSIELFDAEFVANVRSELEDCIDGLEHQQLRLEVLKPLRRNGAASVMFAVQRQDGSARSSVYRFRRDKRGQIRITQAPEVGEREVKRYEEVSWSQEPVARTVEAAVIECSEGKLIPMKIQWVHSAPPTKMRQDR